MNCGCRWDGNLDGKLFRCHKHAQEYKQEKDLRKRPRDARILDEVRKHSRAVRMVVELAEEKVDHAV